jgi:isopenicillin-N epimerase
MSAQAKRDFGSFHSSNVQELLSISEDEYRRPEMSVKLDLNSYSDVALQFGTVALKRRLFYLSDEFCFLNHGAFGLTFRPVLEYANEWRAYAESQPLRFYDRQCMPLMCDLHRQFAKLLRCKPTEIALVDNCTFAFNSILHSIDLHEREKIFIFSTTYGAYKKALKSKCEQVAANLIEQAVEFPIKDANDLNDKIVNKLQEALSEDEPCHQIKYVFVDHVTSNQAFVMPIEKLSSVCKSIRPDIVFIVDAAHSLGSIKDFYLESLPHVDFLFTNCHKWFCGPKGTAILYKKNQTTLLKQITLRPAVHSHGIGCGFNSEFIWSGLKDYTNFMGLYAALDVWKNCLGSLNNGIAYCTNLVREAGSMLVKEWQTDFLVDPSLCSTMLCVRLPDQAVNRVLNISDRANNDSYFKYEHAEIIQNYLYFENNIEVPIKCVDGRLYVRISAHVYNCIDDYKRLMQVFVS